MKPGHIRAVKALPLAMLALIVASAVMTTARELPAEGNTSAQAKLLWPQVFAWPALDSMVL